jgi:RNA polymerase sigma-70 factor (ECF subfamily)
MPQCGPETAESRTRRKAASTDRLRCVEMSRNEHAGPDRMPILTPLAAASCVMDIKHRLAITDDWTPVIAAARRGDHDCFQLLFHAVQPGLLRYLRTLVGDDAADVASETWLQAVRDLRSFEGDGSAFRGWMVTIGRHRALDLLRYQQRRPAQLARSEHLVDLAGRDDTAGAVIESLSTEEAVAVIATLPPDQAEAVLLRVVMGLDVETTARVLHKRPGAVRTAVYRGLRTLATRIDPKP